MLRVQVKTKKGLNILMTEPFVNHPMDALEHTLSGESLTFSIMGEPKLTESIRNVIVALKLEHSYFPKQGLPSDGGFQHIKEKWVQLKSRGNPAVANLYYQSSVRSTLCVTVPDGSLVDTCELFSSCLATHDVSSGIVLMNVQTSPTQTFSNLDAFFSVLDQSMFLSPSYCELVDFNEEWKRFQCFNYPTAYRDENSGESVASLYGAECDWKFHTYTKPKEYVSSFPLWWEFTSELLKKNRTQQQNAQKNDALAEMLESISLNRSSIIEMSWELEDLKNRFSDDSSP